MNSGNPLTLNDLERDFLRKLAWEAVSTAARDVPAPDPAELAAEEGLELSPRLLAPRGAFVTLHSAGQLRGCIGYIEGVKPLVGAVVANGRSAAVSDPRFSPVGEKELSSLDLEVSVLTPLVEIQGPAEIILGQHGILLVRDGRRAVFLPQVAVEQGWDLETTLTHLAVKAGLGPDGWRIGTKFLVFEADVF